MALTEEQALMDSQSKNLGYAIKSDSDLRLMVREIRSIIETFEEEKNVLISKEDEIKDSVKIDPNDFTLENNLIVEEIEPSYNGITISALEEIWKDEIFTAKVDNHTSRIEKINKNLNVLLGEMELRLEDVVERTIEGGQ